MAPIFSAAASAIVPIVIEWLKVPGAFLANSFNSGLSKFESSKSVKSVVTLKLLSKKINNPYVRTGLTNAFVVANADSTRRLLKEANLSKPKAKIERR